MVVINIFVVKEPLQMMAPNLPEKYIDILNKYDSYRIHALEHASSLSWLNRTKDLIKIFNKYAN